MNMSCLSFSRIAGHLLSPSVADKSMLTQRRDYTTVAKGKFQEKSILQSNRSYIKLNHTMDDYNAFTGAA